MQHGSKAQNQLIRSAITEGSVEQLEAVIDAVKDTGAIQYTAQLAQKEADAASNAIQNLRDNPYKQALLAVAHFAVHRSF